MGFKLPFRISVVLDDDIELCILVAAVGKHFFEHATGIEAIVLYDPRIFKKAGIKSKEKLLLTTIGVGLTKTLFINFSTFLLDKVGRRKLLLISTAGMIVIIKTRTCSNIKVSS